MGGYVLGGLLSGIGQGMAAQAQSDAAARREVALEKLRAQNSAQEAATAHSNKMDEMTVDADLRDRNAARQTGRDTSSKIVIDNNSFGHQVTLENLKTSNDAKLAQVQSRLRMTEDKAKAAQDLVNSATLAGQEVGEVRVSENGTMFVFSKTGKVLNQSKPGTFVPTGVSKSGSSDAGTGTLAAAAAGRQGRQPQTGTAPQAKVIRYDAKGNRIQ